MQDFDGVDVMLQEVEGMNPNASRAPVASGPGQGERIIERVWTLDDFEGVEEDILQGISG